MDLFPVTLGGRENGNRQESGGGSRGWDIRRSKLIGSTENRSQIGFCWISTKDCRIPKRSDTAHELRGNVWRTIRASSEAIDSMLNNARRGFTLRTSACLVEDSCH